jgi:catechol 2,3-dioxygenase-like lactoylglutathione lyase family enzyme
MNAAVPTLRIGDYPSARRFYVDGLGFAVDWEWRDADSGDGEPARAGQGDPVFLQISRGPLRLYLSRRAGDGVPGGLVHLYVADVDGWQAQMLRQGIVAEGPPVDQPWGNRELRVRDPDGNQLCICAVTGGSE